MTDINPLTVRAVLKTLLSLPNPDKRVINQISKLQEALQKDEKRRNREKEDFFNGYMENK